MIILHVIKTKNETLARFLIFPLLIFHLLWSLDRNWPQKLHTQICISTKLLIIDVKWGKKQQKNEKQNLYSIDLTKKVNLCGVKTLKTQTSIEYNKRNANKLFDPCWLINLVKIRRILNIKLKHNRWLNSIRVMIKVYSPPCIRQCSQKVKLQPSISSIKIFNYKVIYQDVSAILIITDSLI